MRDEHVVEDEEVALLPGKVHRSFTHQGADFV
jgi:hypothetical protein